MQVEAPSQVYQPQQPKTSVIKLGSEDPSDGLPYMWKRLAEEHGDRLALIDPHQSPVTKMTFRELESHIRQFAAGLHSLGIQPGDRVRPVLAIVDIRRLLCHLDMTLFSENSSRWLVADQGAMLAGAADAVRGTTAPPEEMAYILAHSRSVAVVAQDTAALERLLPLLDAGGGAPATNGAAAGFGAAAPNGNGANANGASGAASANGAGGHKASQRLLRFAIVLWGEPSDRLRSGLDVPVLSFSDVLAAGHRMAEHFAPPALRPSDLATLVYTSGTTGNPKGVMLTHGNLLYQLKNLHYYVDPQPGQTSLSLLPPWHIYERTCGYLLLSSACTQVYTNIRRFKEDLTAYPPDFFVCVPLVLDTLYSKVRAMIRRSPNPRRTIATFLMRASVAWVRARRIVMGLSLQLAQALVYAKVRKAVGIRGVIVSGGGSLQPHLDDFFEALGLPLLNGWGLTETSPVLACRRAGPSQIVRGSVGWPMPGTEVRVVAPDTRRPVPDGTQGLLLARGPGVMRGYLGDEGATAAAFQDGGGWFDTGDLGWRAPSGVPGSCMGGVLVLTGRAKDTIVLSNGENVEPAPIEDACAVSPLIKHTVLVGQDRRSLGALVVPDADALAEAAAARGQDALSEEEVRTLIRGELTKATAGRPGHEGIGAFVILGEAFSPEAGTLTRTLKPRRPVIFAKYAREVAQLMAQLR